VRLMMALKLLSLGRGASGVTLGDRRADPGHAAAGVTPVIPAGLGRRVGRSGAAGAHGRGDDRRGRGLWRASACPAAEALAARGTWRPSSWPQGRPGADQRHAILHRLALAGLFGPIAQSARRRRDRPRCRPTRSWVPPRRWPEIHALRGHRGQIDVAAAMRA
jgi:histidine ammonia-lyase